MYYKCKPNRNETIVVVRTKILFCAPTTSVGCIKFNILINVCRVKPIGAVTNLHCVVVGTNMTRSRLTSCTPTGTVQKIRFIHIRKNFKRIMYVIYYGMVEFCTSPRGPAVDPLH